MKWLTILKWGGGVVGGLALAWVVYAGLIRPTTKPPTTTTNQADVINNYNVNPKVTFGCANWLVDRKNETR